MYSRADAQEDPLLEINGAAGENPLSEIRGIPGRDSLSRDESETQADSAARNKANTSQDGPEKKMSADKDDLINIVDGAKTIRAKGWGEYRVGGRCLCCDNMLDGDCIIVHSTNKTRKVQIKQIVDGNTRGDPNDKTTYFGDVEERDRPEYVLLIMAEIDLKEFHDIYRVTVYTMVDKKNNKSFLPNCELGYYDQFDRLKWVGKRENKKNEAHITFEMEWPIYTDEIFIKASGGRSRITEVAIFTRGKQE